MTLFDLFEILESDIMQHNNQNYFTINVYNFKCVSFHKSSKCVEGEMLKSISNVDFILNLTWNVSLNI